jgi:hypothetical protein
MPARSSLPDIWPVWFTFHRGLLSSFSGWLKARVCFALSRFPSTGGALAVPQTYPQTNSSQQLGAPTRTTEPNHAKAAQRFFMTSITPPSARKCRPPEPWITVPFRITRSYIAGLLVRHVSRYTSQREIWSTRHKARQNPKMAGCRVPADWPLLDELAATLAFEPEPSTSTATLMAYSPEPIAASERSCRLTAAKRADGVSG